MRMETDSAVLEQAINKKLNEIQFNNIMLQTGCQRQLYLKMHSGTLRRQMLGQFQIFEIRRYRWVFS